MNRTCACNFVRILKKPAHCCDFNLRHCDRSACAWHEPGLHYLRSMETTNTVWIEGADRCADNWMQMPRDSRTWVYLANRALTAEEVELFVNGLEAFMATWEAHGKKLKASWRLSGNRLLFIAVDESEAPATGCSIDLSVAYLNGCTEMMHQPLDWFDRQNNLYALDGAWYQASNANFWALRKSKRISDTTQLVNVVFQAPGSCWGEVVIPFSESWHAEMW